MNLEKTEGTERIEELRAFLLGTLAETDVERVEYSVLADDDLYELLLATEEELIDEYLSGDLSPGEASSFLGYLDNLPGGRTRIAFARDLRNSLAGPPETIAAWRSRWEVAAMAFFQFLRGQRPAWAAALVLSTLAVAFYASMAYREPAPLVLTAGLTRSEGEIPTASLSSSVRRLRVALDLGVQAHDLYRATLYDADARAISSTEELTAIVTEKRILVLLSIPVAGLEPGDYSISLEGEFASAGYEPVERYVFRLIE